MVAAKKKLSGWDRYDQIMEAGGAALVLLVLSLIALVLGLFCLKWSKGDADTWADRPQKLITAELESVESTRSSKSESNYYYVGTYAWEYQGSSGTFTDDNRYDYETLVPATLPVHIYLDTNDTWHLMGLRGEGVATAGYLLIGGIVLTVGGAINALIWGRMFAGQISQTTARNQTQQTRLDAAELGPMGVFAQQACYKYLKGMAKPEQYKVTKKLVKGLGIEAGEHVFLGHDASMNFNGKEGFAITERGFVCRDLLEKRAARMSWAELAQAGEPQLSGNYIVAGQTKIVYFSDEAGKGPNKALVTLCQDLYAGACKQ